MKKRFIFDDNYIKKYAKKDKTKWLLIGVCALVLILTVIIVILGSKDNDKPIKSPVVPIVEIKDEVVIESGDRLPEVVDYFEKLENVDINAIEIIYPEEFEIGYDNSKCDEAELKEMEENENFKPEDYDCLEAILKTPTVYGITLKVLEKEYTVNLVVVDKTPPVVITKSVEIFENDTYKVEDFVKLCFDVNDECNIKYYDQDKDDKGNVIDYSKIKAVGTHTIKLIAEDKYGNISRPVEVKLTIKEVETVIYSVSFNSDGGTDVKTQKVEEGKTIVEPKEPTKKGYYFVGWYLNNEEFNFNTPINKDIELKAKWKKIEEVQNPNGDGSGNGNSGQGGNNTGDDKPQVVPVTGVYLDFSKIYVYINESKTVKATVRPTNATNKNVVWSSSDNNIAKVDGGVITGVNEGTAIVTVTADGKTDTVEVVVKKRVTTPTCKYGDTNYNSNYILSVDLTINNCAVDPNGAYNESVSTRDYQNLVKQINNMGLKLNDDTFYYKANHFKVKNNVGTGLVGYQITIYLKVIDVDNPYILMEAEYIIKSDGTRQFIKNNIEKNGVKFK